MSRSADEPRRTRAIRARANKSSLKPRGSKREAFAAAPAPTSSTPEARPGRAPAPAFAKAPLAPLRFLKELMAIDSPTRDAAGVERVQAAIARELAGMGFAVRRLANPVLESADLLVAELAPAARGERRFATLVGHADTVLSHQDGGRFRMRSDGVHARGSGVIDDKGGLVVALKGVELYLEQCRKRGKPPGVPLRFVCSPNEETGSPGFTETYRRLAQDSALALGFEPALENGNVVDSRRGNRWYRIEVRGIEAHAGRSKGEHVNAAHELAIKIAQLHRLNDSKRGVSANVGRLDGGKDAFNVVCGHASCKLDARFATFADRDRLHAAIERIVAKSNVRSADGAHASSASWSLADDCPPFAGSGKAKRWVDAYLASVREIEGRAIAAERAGGAGDVNYMSDRHVAVIDGLGPVGGGMHTPDESIFLPSLQTRAEALAAFLLRCERMAPFAGHD